MCSVRHEGNIARGGCNMCGILGRMTDAERAEAWTELQQAADDMRDHEQKRVRLVAAIVRARKAGWRPSEIDAIVPYDRNHIRRITKAAGIPALREAHDDDRSSA
jgi:hypothetical protein